MIERTEQYDLLQGLGCSARLAEAVDRLCQDGILSHQQLSDQVIDNLKALPEGVALQAVQKLRVSDLSSVKNRSAFFLGVIRSFRSHGVTQQQVLVPESQASNMAANFSYSGQQSGVVVAPASGSGGGDIQPGQVTILKRPPPSKNAPDAAKLKEILARTGYTHEVSTTLRKYGGPPPNWTGPKPGPGTEVFLGRLPQDVYEDDLIPVFETVGKIYELRVIVDNEGYNRGYGFVTYCDKDTAKEACRKLNRYEIKGNRRMIVKLSVQFNRLYVGGIPKGKSKDDIFSAFEKEVENLKAVILQDPPAGASSDVKNRGFCFLEFDSYFEAAAARKRLMNGRQKITSWDNFSRFIVDWAIPLENPDEDVVANSTAILVNNLTEGITNDDLVARFQKYGRIKKVNKKNHYAFITYNDRTAAEAAETAENQQILKDAQIDVQIHVPLTGVAKRMVQTIKGTPASGGQGGAFRQQQQANMYAAVPNGSQGGFVAYSNGSAGAGGRGRGRGGIPRRAGTFTKTRMMARGMGFPQQQAAYDPYFNQVQQAVLGPSGYAANAGFNAF